MWNAVLAQEDWFDAVVYHEYYGGQGFPLESSTRFTSAVITLPVLLPPVTAVFSAEMGKP